MVCPFEFPQVTLIFLVLLLFALPLQEQAAVLILLLMVLVTAQILAPRYLLGALGEQILDVPVLLVVVDLIPAFAVLVLLLVVQELLRWPVFFLEVVPV